MDLENKYGALEVQKALLVLLKEFHAFCQAHQIVYSLDSGTLLGAIRHQGFIPWDDDIDVIMDRTNFEKFCALKFQGGKLMRERSLWVERVRFRPESPEALKSPITPTLDVFILDHVPEGKLARKLMVTTIRFLQGMMKSKPDYSRFSGFQRLLLFSTYALGRLFSDETKYQWYNRLATCYRHRPTKHLACLNYPYHEVGHVFNAHTMDQVELHRFEDADFWIMSDYDAFLTELYGDYMIPPPVEDRKPFHLS